MALGNSSDNNQEKQHRFSLLAGFSSFDPETPPLQLSILYLKCAGILSCLGLEGISNNQTNRFAASRIIKVDQPSSDSLCTLGKNLREGKQERRMAVGETRLWTPPEFCLFSCKNNSPRGKLGGQVCTLINTNATKLPIFWARLGLGL